jgi:hypothetical protein
VWSKSKKLCFPIRKHNGTPRTNVTLNQLHGTESFPRSLTDPQLGKKFPAFYGTRRFITAFTRDRHLSLS